MKNWTTGSCEANGIRIHYLRTGGDGPSLVLLHGLTASGACWAPLARALESGYDVVMPDARGHGNSSAPLCGYRFEDHADYVVGLVRTLRLSRPILVGHSMGGMTAALVASRRATGIRGVVLVDPTFLSPERQLEVRDSDVALQHRRFLGLQKSEIVAQARARHPRRSPELLDLLAEARLQTRMSAFDVLAPPHPDFRRVVGGIDVPCLLVIGDTPVVSLDTAMELRRLNPHVRVEQIRDAGHGLPYDQTERLAQVVGSFVRDG